MRRISALQMRFPWSRTSNTLPSEMLLRLELLASLRFKNLYNLKEI